MTYLIAVAALFAQAPPTAPDVDKMPAPAVEQAVPADDAKTAAAPSGDAEPVAEDESESDSGGMSFWEGVAETGLLKLLIRGGWFMLPILVLGIIAFGVIIERYRSLKMLSTDSYHLRDDVKTLLEVDDPEGALAACEKEQGPVAAILSAGLRKYVVARRLGHDQARIEEQVVKAMDDYSVHIVAAMEKHMPILATISSAAPMLGFLGTVAGMIVSFDSITENIGKMNIVEAAAGGISVALLTTCFGLIIGIPAYVAFNYYNGVINRFVLEVEESATELIETVTLQETLDAPVDSSNPKTREAQEA